MASVAVSLMWCTIASADLNEVLAEPKLERRSEMALANADAELDRARAAYSSGKSDEFKSAINEAVRSVEVSHESLIATGKAARRHPKYFKSAEQKTRNLLKRLTTLENEVSLEDREFVEKARKQVESINDDLVMQIMTKRKK